MHPILRELLMEPVGWMTLGGTVIMVAVGIGVGLFARRRMKAENQRK